MMRYLDPLGLGVCEDFRGSGFIFGMAAIGGSKARAFMVLQYGLGFGVDL